MGRWHVALSALGLLVAAGGGCGSDGSSSQSGAGGGGTSGASGSSGGLNGRGGATSGGTAGASGTPGESGGGSDQTTGGAGTGGKAGKSGGAGGAGTGGSGKTGGNGGKNAGGSGGRASGGAAAATGGSAGATATGGSAGSSGAVFPVRYSDDKRTLVDAAGEPFPILGRTAWFLISRPATDQQTFLADTVSRGHNAIEMMGIERHPMGNKPPFAGNGEAPFTKRLDGAAWKGSIDYGDIEQEAPDFATPNEAYWSFVDQLLDSCDRQGILVMFFPAYVGHWGNDEGFMQEMVANGSAKLKSYGAFLANRYKNQKNLVWMMGGDFGSGDALFDSSQTAVEKALLDGLNSVSGQQSIQFSAEWTSGSIGTDQKDFGSAMTLNSVYSWDGDVASLGRRAYSHTPIEPAFLLEEPYDEEGPDGNGYNPSSTQPVRRFQWFGLLSTIAGYMSGNGYVWPFKDPEWKRHLDTQGARDMAVLNSFWRSVSWWQLVPSGLAGMKTLITAGAGNPSDETYVASAATPGGSLLVAYVPPGHSGSITVNLSALSAVPQGYWLDPTKGTTKPISGLSGSSAVLSTPGNNAAGDPDWLLVLSAN